LFLNAIASQNERSGFVTLIQYVGIVYGFLGDVFIFNQQFGLLEILAAVLILAVNIVVIVSRLLTKDKESEVKPKQ